MQKRIRGKNGPEVNAFGPCCLGMSYRYGPASDKQKMTALMRQVVGLERGPDSEAHHG